MTTTATDWSDACSATAPNPARSEAPIPAAQSGATTAWAYGREVAPYLRGLGAHDRIDRVTAASAKHAHRSLQPGLPGRVGDERLRASESAARARRQHQADHVSPLRLRRRHRSAVSSMRRMARSTLP